MHQSFSRHNSRRDTFVPRCRRRKNNYAFLDINPVGEGHMAGSAQARGRPLFDLPENEYVSLELFGPPRCRGCSGQAMPRKRIAEVVLGLEVPHAHIHLIPIHSEAHVDFHKTQPQPRAYGRDWQSHFRKIRTGMNYNQSSSPQASA